MALGRRRHRSERQKIDATPPWSTDRERDTEVTTGPYDQDDAPDDGLERLDLGALLVPVMRGVEVRVDVGPDGQVIAATLSYGGSEAQIGVFAAPRTAGIWDEVRKEINASIVQQGGKAQESSGRFGTELSGRIPVQGGYQSVRFIGVDGPRWFLRGVLTGKPAVQPGPETDAELFAVFREIVVVRGDEAMAPRDPIPLRLPVAPTVSPAEAGMDEEESELKPFERGPEITEIH